MLYKPLSQTISVNKGKSYWSNERKIHKTPCILFYSVYKVKWVWFSRRDAGKDLFTNSTYSTSTNSVCIACGYVENGCTLKRLFKWDLKIMDFLLFSLSIRRKVASGEKKREWERRRMRWASCRIGLGWVRVRKICYSYHGNCQMQTMIYVFASFANFIFAFTSTQWTRIIRLRFGIHIVCFMSRPFHFFFLISTMTHISVWQTEIKDMLSVQKQREKPIVVVSWWAFDR